MFSYFLKRIFLFLPTLLIIALLMFFLSKYASGDPVLNQVENTSKVSKVSSLKEIQKVKQELGLDLPNFYFSVCRKTACPNPNTYSKKTVKQLENWAYQLGSWSKAAIFYKALLVELQDPRNENRKQKLLSILQFERIDDIKEVVQFSDNGRLIEITQGWKKNDWSAANYLITFQWNGFQNQFHRWVSGILKGNFGKSYQDGSSINRKVIDALYWTILLSIISLLLSFLIAVPVGVYAAAHQGSKFDKITSTLFFGFYALPTFWIATLSVVFLCSGEFLKWFPSYGLGQISENATLFESLQIRISHLFLPILCSTYGSLAFIFRQIRAKMLEELQSEYIKTAKSKGINSFQLLWKHAFKNASFPLYTILGNVLPAIVSGAFVIEYIFAIPGMGKLTIDSFLVRDYPVIFAIVLIVSLFTLIGSWLADVLYHINDPRFNINASNNA